ncbi:folate family ECF transporter S component [Mariniplasma anaerobium]|uniref:Membrane protein n=1 Tax=Mariniplasma anaerobium TaxID=2735436 RepID=A0A7U9XXH3_9MOLU|nr:folate family ECF transporter S component [Mariniplasma anaerobium]BCR36533.1 membrane protein [Mariniplasma anaerobium]
MKKSKELQKLVLASSLVAISIVIDVFFKQILSFNNFGVPFYAIPIIYGSIILGPLYGLIMGYVSDLVGFVAFPNGAYAFIFALGAMLWGFIPGLFLYKKFDKVKLVIVVAITHILVTIANTIGLLAFLSVETALASLTIRLAMIPVNVVIITLLVSSLYQKLLPVLVDMQIKNSNELKESKSI